MIKSTQLKLQCTFCRMIISFLAKKKVLQCSQNVVTLNNDLSTKDLTIRKYLTTHKTNATGATGRGEWGGGCRHPAVDWGQ